MNYFFFTTEPDFKSFWAAKNISRKSGNRIRMRDLIAVWKPNAIFSEDDAFVKTEKTLIELSTHEFLSSFLSDSASWTRDARRLIAAWWRLAFQASELIFSMKDVMARLAAILGAVIVVILVIGGVVLATVDIPAPSAKVERPVPDSRLAK